MSVYTCITANYWCGSEECSMASKVRTIIPDYQNTNIKKIFIKIVSTDCKAHQRTQLKKIFTLQVKTRILEK